VVEKGYDSIYANGRLEDRGLSAVDDWIKVLFQNTSSPQNSPQLARSLNFSSFDRRTAHNSRYARSFSVVISLEYRCVVTWCPGRSAPRSIHAYPPRHQQTFICRGAQDMVVFLTSDAKYFRCDQPSRALPASPAWIHCRFEEGSAQSNPSSSQLRRLPAAASVPFLGHPHLSGARFTSSHLDLRSLCVHSRHHVRSAL
jgi:hypothetical protein